MKKTVLLLCVAMLVAVMALGACSAPPAESPAATPEAPAATPEAPAATPEAPAATPEESAAAGGDFDPQSVQLAFIPGLTTDEFYISMNRGIQDKAAELGYKEVLFQGAAEWDYTKQTPVLESMITKQVDFIFIAPNHVDSMNGTLQKVKDAGIPVITVDTDTSDVSLRLANITSDNLQGGDLAAQFIAEDPDRTGNQVAIINTKPGITTTDMRQEGFIAGCEERDLEVVAQEYCDDISEKAASQIQAIYLKYPDLAGAFGTNLYSAKGVSDGLKAKGAELPIVCYDAGPAQIEALEQGIISATIVQKPMEEGSTAVQFADYYFRGETDKIEPQVLIPAIVATPDNYTDPEVSKWFYVK